MPLKIGRRGNVAAMAENRTIHLAHDSLSVQTHLTIMQDVIQRMAENSRFCKVWCVTLVSAVLVLVARTGEPLHALIALTPAALFWMLDAYYLGLEHRFRCSYNTFIGKIHQEEALLTDVYIIKPDGSAARSFLRATFRSFSVLPFYVLIATTILLAYGLVL